MTGHRARRLGVGGFVVWLFVSVALRADVRPIDIEQSTITVYAYKSGFFSAFADDHVIRAPIASGSISTEAPLGVKLSIRTESLRVLDPSMPVSRRADVQKRMLGPEVLDSVKFPEIEFVSTALEQAGPDRWTIIGRLTVHGITHETKVAVAHQDGHYRGTTTLKQSEFGIDPISIVGGTVKVKDELKIEFDIVPGR